MRSLPWLLLVAYALAREEGWQPVIPEASITYNAYLKSSDRAFDTSNSVKILNRRPSINKIYGTSGKLSNLHNVAQGSEGDSCNLYKVSMNQELYYQYVEYEKDFPDLKEFTLCMWNKFHNHSDDHPLFSYAVPGHPKEISAWISNTKQESYFSMAIHGQTFFRLNYPLKLNTWYHVCQSWNGKTGEWQIWINAERVGRGFNNRLVGHVIKGGGIAISGQEQSLLYKNKDELSPMLQKSGLIGEITMLQLYHVALTAGKAHKDHKHHHAHHFKHDGTPIEPITEPATEPPMPQPTPIGNGAFLIGGQLQRAPSLNLAGGPQQQQMISAQLANGVQIQQPYVNGQLGNRIVSEQLLTSQLSGSQIPNGQIQIGQVPIQIPSVSGIRSSLGPSKGTKVVLSGSLINPANVQFIDDTIGHDIFRRDSNKRDKRDNPEEQLKEDNTGKKKKRGLIALPDGSIIDEALLSPDLTDSGDEEDTLLQKSLLNGLAGFVGNLPVQNTQKQQVDEREPAEAEVKAVMQICGGCAPEPFKKALVLSWRTTPKKLFSGAHYYKGLPICRAF